MDKISLESAFHWLSEDSQVQDRSGGLQNICKNVRFQVQIIEYSAIAARHPGYHK